MSLNEHQRLAAQAPNGYLQILAGPGTGKTVTLVSRITELLERGIPPEEMCVLSFTKAAAAELKHRVAAKVGKECNITIGTFHSIAFRFLRKYGGESYKDLAVIDDTEKQEILTRIVKDSQKAKQLLRIISRIQVFNEKVDNEAMEIFEKYRDLTKSLNRVDFDGLLCRFYDFLATSDRVPNSLAAVFVDEFQDTSLIQLRIALLLASKCHNLTVVGDPDQSIYSFRNAEPKNFDLMLSMVPKGYKVYQRILGLNYRSSQPILDAAQRVISPNRVTGDLNTSRKLKAARNFYATPVKYVPCGSTSSEAQAVASHVAFLVSCGIRPSEICILTRRSTSYRVLEAELLLHGIEAKTVGGKRVLIGREVKAVIDYIRVALNNKDQLAISRTLNYPSRKLGPAAARKVASGDYNLPCMHKIRKQASVDPKFKQYIDAVDRITCILGQERGLQEVKEAVQYCIETMFQPINGDPDASNVAQLLELAVQFSESLEEENDPDETLTFAEQFVNLWPLGSSKTDPNSKVTLSTIHSAKGLEWPIVFLIGAAPEVSSTIHSSGRDGSEDEEDEAVESSLADEEEIRLIYVALTRAKSYLVVTSPSYGFDGKLKIAKSMQNAELDDEIDASALSECVARTITQPVKQKSQVPAPPTRLGKAIDLADGFMLASDLPMRKDTLLTEKRVKTRVEKKPSIKTDAAKTTAQTPKPNEKKNTPKKGLLAYFRPAV